MPQDFVFNWADNQWFSISVILLTILTLPIKGWGLWRAARKKDLVWFIIFLLVNSLGILELLYLFIFSKVINIQSDN